MKKRWASRAMVGLLGSGVAAGICLFGNWLPTKLGCCLNITPSEPVGFYRRIDGKPVRDALVLFKQPQNRRASVLRLYLPINLPLIKRVAAVPNDVVQIDRSGVRVNGVYWPDSVPLSHDREGRLLTAYPFGAYRVALSELWVMSNNPRGLDSRYFGPVPLSNVISRLVPVATWTSTFVAQMLALTYALGLAAIAVVIATSIVTRLNALTIPKIGSSGC